MADWRVTVQLHNASRAARAVLRGQVAEGIRDRLGRLATVSSPGGSELFIYADTEAVAGEAAQVARDVLDNGGLQAEVRLNRWSPLTSEWDDGAEASLLPDWQLADAEHRRQVAQDAQRSQATGVAQWTVRVTLPSRHDAIQLAAQLRAEGVVGMRRGKSVVLGGSDEDAARELAQRAAERAPAAEVHVGRTFVYVPPADFGGLLLG